MVLFENTDVLVINKPAGLVVHPDGKSDEVTLSDLLVKKYPDMRDVGEPLEIQTKEGIEKIPRPGIVHRLDRDTSGVIIVAKNQKAFEFLKEQFQKRETEKIYYAYTYGWIKNDKEIIDAVIGRSNADVRKWTAGRGTRGVTRDARTEYEVIKRLGHTGERTLDGGEEKESLSGTGSTEEGTYTFVKLIPKTGRTHQLRVHLRYINHPIVGDTLYAPNRASALGFTRLALHAFSLKITLPDGTLEKFEAPFPEDFKKAENLA